MDQLLPGSSLVPALKIGTTLATLRLSGKILIEIQQLKISVNEDDIICAEIFIILLGIVSIPLALPLGKLTSKLCNLFQFKGCMSSLDSLNW